MGKKIKVSNSNIAIILKYSFRQIKNSIIKNLNYYNKNNTFFYNSALKNISFLNSI